MPEASTALADLVEPAWPASAPRGLLDDDHRPGASSAFRVALLIPMCGSAGIWGPSCIASAQVAAHELNRRNGIAGRDVQLVLIDSAIEAQAPVESLVHSLIETRSIDAIVGMHISAVRQRLTKVVAGPHPLRLHAALRRRGARLRGVVHRRERLLPGELPRLPWRPRARPQCARPVDLRGPPVPRKPDARRQGRLAGAGRLGRRAHRLPQRHAGDPYLQFQPPHPHPSGSGRWDGLPDRHSNLLISMGCRGDRDLVSAPVLRQGQLRDRAGADRARRAAGGHGRRLPGVAHPASDSESLDAGDGHSNRPRRRALPPDRRPSARGRRDGVRAPRHPDPRGHRHRRAGARPAHRAGRSVEDLVWGQLVNAMQDAAASRTLDQMHKDRAGYTGEVAKRRPAIHREPGPDADLGRAGARRSGQLRPPRREQCLQLRRDSQAREPGRGAGRGALRRDQSRGGQEDGNRGPRESARHQRREDRA